MTCSTMLQLITIVDLKQKLNVIMYEIHKYFLALFGVHTNHVSSLDENWSWWISLTAWFNKLTPFLGKISHTVVLSTHIFILRCQLCKRSFIITANAWISIDKKHLIIFTDFDFYLLTTPGCDYTRDYTDDILRGWQI